MCMDDLWEANLVALHQQQAPADVFICALTALTHTKEQHLTCGEALPKHER